ncbi:MAG: NAD(P)H-dependent oxidoreductase [Pseudomonas sp.]
MTTLLHIQCSPRKQRSASREIACSFITRFQDNTPDTEIVTLDLWNIALPEFDELAMEAKYAGLNGTPLTPAQQGAWNTLRDLAAHLHRADVLVMSVPLWNFSVPYKLKHFIDLVSQKDILFSFDPERGLEGMLNNKTAVVMYARGLDYSAKSSTPAPRYDFQKPYVEAWLEFVGATEVYSVIVEKTILGEDVDRNAREAATQQARRLADSLSSRLEEVRQS